MSDANALKDLGNKAFAAKNWDQAIDFFTQAIALDPSNHVLYSNRSAAKAGKKLWDDALADAEKTISVNPAWSKGYARKGAALHGARRWDDAIAAYEEGLKLEPGNAALTKGLKEVRDAQNADSAADATGLGSMFRDPALFSKLAANPKTAPLLADEAFMAKLRMIQANPALAASAFNDPKMISVLGVLMGVDMEGFARPEGSNDFTPPGASASTSTPPPPASTSTPKQEPPKPKEEPKPEPMEVEEEEDETAKAKKDALAEKALGAEAYKKRDLEKAGEHFAKAWDLWPGDITFLTNLAAVYFEQGDYNKSIETCQTAIEEGRSLRADYKLVAKAYGRIGSAYSKLEDYENAIKFYNKSLTEHRTADILNKLKDAEKAKKDREREAYYNPELSAVAREEGNALFKGGDFVGSVKSYTEAIARDPSDPKPYNNRSAAYTKLTALPEALKDVEKALELDPTFVKAWIRKSNVLFGMREYTKSMEAAQKAADVDTDQKNAREIEQQMLKIQQALYSQREGESEEQTLERAMRDPEVASIMQDPVIQQILQQAQQDPKALQDHMRNPLIREKIQKLVNAGIIRTR